jgi:dethiobiotin synthetase
VDHAACAERDGDIGQEGEKAAKLTMHKGILITGTDTGVGKTFVATGLLKALRELGHNVCPMKPLETGCSFKKGELVPEDALKLIKAAQVNEPLDLINPYRFRQPLAPAVAAEVEGRIISRNRIISSYRKLSKRHDLIIVEGAGGIMVPVHRKYFIIDLVKDLNLPILVVARPGLGTLNHTLLTLAAAKNRGIEVACVIINYSSKIKNDASVQTSPKVIERSGGVPVLGIVPYLADNNAYNYKKIFLKIAQEILSRIKYPG